MIGLVLVVSLVVVALILTWFSSAQESASNTIDREYFSKQAIGVTESKFDPNENDFIVRLLNNSGDFITVSNVKIGVDAVDYSEDLRQGEDRFFLVDSELICDSGEVLTAPITITYYSNDGLVKQQKFGEELMFSCSPYQVNCASFADRCPAVAQEVDTSNLVPYTEANRNLNIGNNDFFSNSFRGSKNNNYGIVICSDGNIVIGYVEGYSC